jgi:hypothetical protein
MEFLELLKVRTVRAHNGQKSKKIKPSDDSLRSAISWLSQKGYLVVYLIAYNLLRIWK